MSEQEFQAKARKHWAKWLPNKVAALEASGELNQTLQTAAKQAQAEMLELMSQGFQQHEAEEVVLRTYILLPPEEGAAEEPWARKELSALDREYQKQNK